MDNTKRLIELKMRSNTLGGFLDNANEELQSKGMIMLAKVFDTDIVEKLAGKVVLLASWKKEIDEEINALADSVSEEVLTDIMKKSFNDMEDDSGASLSKED